MSTAGQSRSANKNAIRSNARTELAPRRDNNSLRTTSRQPPEHPGNLFVGDDRAAADLSFDAPRPDEINPKTGERWLYPKRRKSNLENFKQEIEERTRNGQGAKAIAEALIEKGVDTNGKAVSATRLKWGIRQTKSRRMTEQGIANIRKAALEQKARTANTSRRPKLSRKEWVRKMREAEVLRMSKEGMSMTQVAENLQARGVTLKSGTLVGMYTRLDLTPDPEFSVKHFRKYCKKKALEQQKQQFDDIASELGIQDVEAWTKSKMDDEFFIIARRVYAFKLMGNARPTNPGPGKRKVTTQESLPGQNHVEPPTNHEATSAEPDTSPGPGAAHELIEISDDDTDMESEADEDCEGSDDDEALAKEIKPEPSPSQPSSAIAPSDHSLQPPPTETRHALHNPQRSPAVLIHAPDPNATIVNRLQGGVSHPQDGAGVNMQERPAGPTGIGHYGPPQHAQAQQHQQSAQQYYNSALAVSAPSQSSSQGVLEPRQPAESTPGYRPIAPRPTDPGSVSRPPLPSPPTVTVPPAEAEIMARYGLRPVATSDGITRTYRPPPGPIVTNGYEYLPGAPMGPTRGSHVVGGMSTQQQQQQQPQPQSQLQPQSQQSQRQHRALQRNQNAGPNRTPNEREPEVMVTPPPPPPPPLMPSNIPAPPLVIPPEEVERHKASYGVILKHQKAGFECMQHLMARVEAKPLPESLTGLPPSLQDIEDAKVRLRESAEAMLASLG